MIEQLVESTIIDHVKTAIATIASNVQFFGFWQPGAAGEIKATMDAFKNGFVSVKVRPRAYDNFTAKEANLAVHIEASFRVESDAAGVDYLAAASAIMDLLNSWHKSFAVYSGAFALPNQFSPTGFRLDGGDGDMAVQTGVWTFLADFTVQGIITE